MKVWEGPLSSFLRQLIRTGTLLVRSVDGRVERYGEGGVPAEVVVQFHDRRVARDLVLNPSLGLGDGSLTVGCPSRVTMSTGCSNCCCRTWRHGAPWGISGCWRRFGGTTGRGRFQFTPPARARRNAAHHYDLSETLYTLFLDRDLQYSCVPTSETLKTAWTRPSTWSRASWRFGTQAWWYSSSNCRNDRTRYR